MKTRILCIQYLRLWMTVAVMLMLSQGAIAQPYKLQCDGLSTSTGQWSSPGFSLSVVTGQSQLKTASSTEYRLVPGLLGCVARQVEQTACPGEAIARLETPAVYEEGSQIEVPLYVDMSGVPAPDDKLGSFSGTLSWNPALLSFAGHLGPASGYIGAVNTANAASGLLEFSGINPTGTAGDVMILVATFDVTGETGKEGVFDLNFTDLLAAGTFRNLLPCLETGDHPFTIEDGGLIAGFCGDVDNDATASSSDALLILSYDVGIEIPEAIEEKIDSGCGDVDGNGATNSSDALIILSYDAGIAVPYPVGQSGSCTS